MAPKIYHYHPVTGQYLGTGAADPSPLEPGQWLYPAHSTTLAPPAEQAGYLRVWDGLAWQQQAIPEPEPEREPEPDTSPNWIAALQQIHAGLGGASPANPFVQIRFWADTSVSWQLDARIKDFVSAFQQPLDDDSKRGAVQAGLNRVWSALSPIQQGQFNTADLDSWIDTNNLGLTKPWEVL